MLSVCKLPRLKSFILRIKDVKRSPENFGHQRILVKRSPENFAQKCRKLLESNQVVWVQFS